MNILARAFVRTQGRFQRLFETFIEEYWKANNNFSEHGFSLRPLDISKRSCNVATLMILITICATLPFVLYYRGFEDPHLYAGLLYIFMFSWVLFFGFLWLAHILWATSFIIGSKFAGSQFFWGYIEKRWTQRIDQITSQILHENRRELLETLKEVGDEADVIHDKE